MLRAKPVHIRYASFFMLSYSCTFFWICCDARKYKNYWSVSAGSHTSVSKLIQNCPRQRLIYSVPLCNGIITNLINNQKVERPTLSRAVCLLSGRPPNLLSISACQFRGFGGKINQSSNACSGINQAYNIALEQRQSSCKRKCVWLWKAHSKAMCSLTHGLNWFGALQSWEHKVNQS